MGWGGMRRVTWDGEGGGGHMGASTNHSLASLVVYITTIRSSDIITVITVIAC